MKDKLHRDHPRGLKHTRRTARPISTDPSGTLFTSILMRNKTTPPKDYMENQESVEDAKRAYELSCQEREILIGLAQDAYDSGLKRDQFEEILKEAGYPHSLAKTHAENYWELAEDNDNSEDEEEV